MVKVINYKTDKVERQRNRKEEGKREERRTIGTFIQTLITACNCNLTVGGEVPSLSSKTGVGGPSLEISIIASHHSSPFRPVGLTG